MTIDLKPVLAETLPDGRLEHYITNDDWVAEQKLDGQRVLVRVRDGRVEFLQRQGKPTSKDMPHKVRSVLSTLGGDEWYFDGELIGGTNGVLWLFDMPVALDKVGPGDELYFRKQMLDAFHEALLEGQTPQLRVLPTAHGTDEKRTLVERVRVSGGEGVMFKHQDKGYDSGRRSRFVLKAKNRNTIDCVVIDTKIDGKDNMKLGVFDMAQNGRLVPVGECTALAGDGASIVKGMVVEVTYLYANDPRAPRLYQPTRPLIRTDKAPDECTIDQLVFTNREVLT
jgi:bifunctional non-homologous end joining protein LigD